MAPTFSGIPEMVHVGDATAVPENPRSVLHVSASVPVPPDSAPVNVMDEAEVDAGGNSTARSSGVDGAAGVVVGVPGAAGVLGVEGVLGLAGGAGVAAEDTGV